MKAFFPGARQSKYRAIPTVVNGHRFASRAEARRYVDLKILERAGEIRNLELQPRFRLEVNGIHIADYFADFLYFEGNERVAEDVKGVETPVFVIKRKLFEALYPGVTFKITGKRKTSTRFAA